MKPPRAAVIGSPISHSLSPLLFSVFSKVSGMPVDYEAIEVPPGRLAHALREYEPLYIGWNVTAPHKVSIMELLNDVDDTAKLAGAVNVVRFGQRRVGFNTDIEGFLAPLEHVGFDPSAPAVVFGAGGAARAVCAALKGAEVEKIGVINRTLSRAKVLADKFGVDPLEAMTVEAKEWIRHAGLLINATSAKDQVLPAGVQIRRDALAYDLTYRPAETPFLLAAKGMGARTLGGLPMLVAQAAATWRIWFKKGLPDEALKAAEKEASEALRAKG